MKTFGLYIRRLRESKDLSQEAVAMNLNITLSAYSKIERNATNPSLRRMMQIAKVLGFELVDYFLSIQEKKSNIAEEPKGPGQHLYLTRREFNEYQMKFLDMQDRIHHLHQEIQRIQYRLD